jgi:aspartate-semialdehyde dehydrogenase
MTRIPCAILGAGGWIGQHFARLLDSHPFFEVQVLTGDRNAGKTLGALWQLAELPVPRELEDLRLVRATARELADRGIRVAFSALPPEEAGPMETLLTQRGIAVFSNASAHRMDPGVPLLVPEANGPAMARAPRGRAPLVTNPNCSTAGLVVPLAPLRKLLSPREVHVSTYQALSGAGYPGVPSLSITDNLLPFIPQEEDKMASESAKILGWAAPGQRGSVHLLAHCLRVPVREGHLETVTVRAGRTVSASEVLEAWKGFAPLQEARLQGELPTAPRYPVLPRTEPDRPQPLRDRWAGEPERARGMAVTVGRLRIDGPFVRFVLLAHNAVRGGAGGSVLNAEYARWRGWLDARD